MNYRRDPAGYQQLMKSAEIAAMVNAKAAEVASNAKAQGRTVSSGAALPVETTSYVTDRAAASVTITHPAGLAMQAKHGVLTRAAAASGLEVTAK